MQTETIETTFDKPWYQGWFCGTMARWKERLRLFDKLDLRQDMSKSDYFEHQRFVLLKTGIPVASFVKIGDDRYILSRLYRANINFQFTDSYGKPLRDVIAHVTRSEVLHFSWYDIQVILGIATGSKDRWVRLMQRLYTSIPKFHRIVDVSLLACQFDGAKMNPVDWHWMKQALFTPRYAMARLRMLRTHKLTIPELKVPNEH